MALVWQRIYLIPIKKMRFQKYPDTCGRGLNDTEILMILSRFLINAGNKKIQIYMNVNNKPFLIVFGQNKKQDCRLIPKSQNEIRDHSLFAAGLIL